MLSLPAAQAQFAKVENFEALNVGPIDDQGGWTAVDDTSAVALDPADGQNQVLAVATDSTYLYHTAEILGDNTRMMFMRFRYAEQLNFSAGLSDRAHPDQFGHFEVELSMTNASSELRINDGGTYDVLTMLTPDTWYNVWVLVDNAADQSQVWLHDRPGDAATPDDQLDVDGQTLFEFRGDTSVDLLTFFIKTGGGSGPSGPLYIDDIYIEDTPAVNLTNPTAPLFALGDLNCDGMLNAFDIDPFVLALTDPAGYAAAYPDCDALLADIDGDGLVNAFDIDPFVQLLTGG